MNLVSEVEIAVSLCFQVHVKLFPLAPHGNFKAFFVANLTSSGATKSLVRNLIILGGSDCC